MNLKGSKGGTLGNVRSRRHKELEGRMWGLNCFSIAMIRDHDQGKLYEKKRVYLGLMASEGESRMEGQR